MALLLCGACDKQGGYVIRGSFPGLKDGMIVKLIRWAKRWEYIDDEVARKQVVDRVRRYRLKIGIVRYAAVIAVILVSGVMVWNWKYRSVEPATLATVSVPLTNVPIDLFPGSPFCSQIQLRLGFP